MCLYMIIDLGYTSRQKEMAKKTRDFDIVFELHFNAC